MLEPDVSMLLEVEIFHLTNNGDVENDVNSTKIYRIKHAVSIFHFISISIIWATINHLQIFLWAQIIGYT